MNRQLEGLYNLVAHTNNSTEKTEILSPSSVSHITYSVPEGDVVRVGGAVRATSSGGVHLPLLGVSDVSLHREIERVRVVEHPQESLNQQERKG